MVANTDEALAKTSKEFGVLVRDYTAAPIFLNTNSKGGHEWVIEFEKPPEDAEAFANVLDDNLKKLNSDYEAKRYKGLAMERLKLHIAPSGTFMKWLKNRNKIGAQQKVPRLSNERNNIEEIIKLIS
jgi:hypothetical protein